MLLKAGGTHITSCLWFCTQQHHMNIHTIFDTCPVWPEKYWTEESTETKLQTANDPNKRKSILWTQCVAREQSIILTYDVVNFSWKPFNILKNLFVWRRGVPSFITKLSKYSLPLNKSSTLSVQFKAPRGALDPLARGLRLFRTSNNLSII